MPKPIPKKRRIQPSSHKQTQTWTLFYANARGIMSKKLSIIEIFGEIKPQIALFTETMTKSPNGINIEGYTFFGRPREKKSCGGVGVLVNNQVKDLITPHETKEDIELCWVSIRRKQAQPIFVGVYYGLQESRNNRNEMLIEMDKLASEVEEKKNEGEVILFMDGNGKIGILGEEISRNGRFLLDVFGECDLHILNESNKCCGQVTRVNRKNTEQKSAIDFVVASEEAEKLIKEVLIDEKGDYLLRGTAPSDHNSFLVKISLDRAVEERQERSIRWRINAPVEKWNEFRIKLAEKSDHCTEIMRDEGGNNLSMDSKYNNWRKTIEDVAHETIGKTTVKTKRRECESFVVRAIRAEKKQAKKDFENEKDHLKKPLLKDIYIEKQKALRIQIESEHFDKIESRFSYMTSQGSNGFWRELRKNKKDKMSDWIAVKDANGQRILDPGGQKKRIAEYYSDLYSFDKNLETHSFHAEVKRKFENYGHNLEFEDEWYSALPSKKEIGEIIKGKKNQKATTDYPNELIKRGEDQFVDCLYPVISHFWEKEIPPKEWNLGLISNVYKGKGDRENLHYQRGITVSSSISMILEEVINSRMTKIVPMSQAQGGGKRGASTRDHVFLLRGAITHALKNKQKMYLTYYDVSKAYDRADVEDMLVTAWEQGLRGKLWRLMVALNTNLTAKIKTRHGLTEEIRRIAGGKQGGKNFGFLFAKMMDVLAEEMVEDERIGVKMDELHIALLEWVDDVATFAIGNDQQNLTLAQVDEFAKKHKLKWGREKCKVMEVGCGKYEETKWRLGNLEIDSCTEYKYLGDWMSRNGSNKKNLEDREIKVMAATRKIISLCGTEVVKKIQMKALLKMHESCTVSTLLTNCETWVLNKSEREKLQRIELCALKKIINIPKTTPTTAIWYVTGLLLTPILIDKKQLLYLKTLLDRPTNNWTKQMLLVLKSNGIGWAKQIEKLLDKYGLENNWETISSQTIPQWKKLVTDATEKKNTETLVEMCYSKKGEKTKTKRLVEILESETYQRKPHMGIFQKSRLKARVYVMSMFGMLQCANNFKFGYGDNRCKECGVLDDENHRINYCCKFSEFNLFHSSVKYDFDGIFSTDNDVVYRTIEVIMHVWNLENGKNETKK